MTQSPQPPQSPQPSLSPETPSPTKKLVIILRWLSIFLSLFLLFAGISIIGVKFDTVTTNVAYISLFLAVILGILQVNKSAFQFVVKERRIGIQIGVVLILVLSIGFNIFLFIPHVKSSPRSSTPRVSSLRTPTIGATPTQTTVVPHETIAVPSYFDPSSQAWTQMENTSSNPGIAVINPNSGPGTSSDANYASRVTQAQHAGLFIVGYVSTAYAGTKAPARTLHDVERDIDAYYRWYPTLDGIFVDEVSTDCGKAYSTYYKPLYDYIKHKGGKATVLLDPGTNTSECYMSAGDIIVNFESTYADYLNWSPDPWASSYPPQRFWQIIYDTTQAQMPQAIARAQHENIGWIYVTDKTGDNPFSTLPSYWSEELHEVSST